MSRHLLLTAVLVASLLLAGCSSGGPATPTPTTASPTATDGGGTGTPTPTAAGTDTPREAGAEGPNGETATATPTLAPADANATAVKRDAVAAIRAVDTYRLAASVDRRLSTNRITRHVAIESEGAVDRPARELRVNQTISGPAGTVRVATYVTNRSIYRRSPAFVRRYNAEWIVRNASANFSRTWRFLDTLARQRFLLGNASVTLAGRTTVNGTAVYVLRADVNETAYNAVLAERLDTASVNVTDATFTFRIATETGLPVRSTGVVNSTVVVRGQAVRVTEEITIRFRAYDEPVTIALPAAAETAELVGDEGR